MLPAMFQILQLQGLSKQFGSKVLFENAEAFITQRSRIALIGPNGSGKSTLIRMIMGEEHPDSGNIAQAKHLSIGYLPQEIARPGTRSVLQEVLRMDGRREELLEAKAEAEKFLADPAASATEEGARQLERYGRVVEELDHLDQYRLEARAKEILTGMGFRESDFHRPLAELSGGWGMRAALARILLIDPDLLLLDEPTNHLDLESLLWLEEFLQRYQG